MKRLTIEFIREKFWGEWYILLTKIYKNNKQKLDYICPKGHKHSITWNDWRSGCRCPYCSNRLVCEDNNLFIRYPKIAEEWNYIKNDIITSYDILPNSNRKVWWVCGEGHEWKATPNNRISNRTRCPYCYGNIKLTIDYIRIIFEKEGYILLTTKYENDKQKLECVCPNGHNWFVSWNNWQAGNRCSKCSYINQSIRQTGVGNPNWKGGIACEPYCDVWLDKEFKESIKQRDGYKCMNPDCWGTAKRLAVHHIDYIKNNCGPRNLITLCTSCNSRANKDEEWHKSWYQAIMCMRYEYKY